MRDLLSSLIGVPAVILLSGGMGIVAVTLISRVRAGISPRRQPIRWAHLAFGVGLTGAGALLLQLDITVVGVH